MGWHPCADAVERIAAAQWWEYTCAVASVVDNKNTDHREDLKVVVKFPLLLS